MGDLYYIQRGKTSCLIYIVGKDSKRTFLGSAKNRNQYTRSIQNHYCAVHNITVDYIEIKDLGIGMHNGFRLIEVTHKVPVKHLRDFDLINRVYIQWPYCKTFEAIRTYGRGVNHPALPRELNQVDCPICIDYLAILAVLIPGTPREIVLDKLNEKRGGAEEIPQKIEGGGLILI